MKNTLFVLIAILGLGFSGNAQVSNLIMEPEYSVSAFAKIAMLVDEHDFGTIEKGVPVSYTFEFENEGDAPLIVSNVKTSCGCTASSYTKEAILPGQTGEVTATYNAAKEGHFNKSLTLSSNGGDVILAIRGEVK